MPQFPTRVFHVDDDPAFGDMTATFLEREDDRFEVQTATSAAEGLAIVRDRPPDCIVSDYEMPGRNGIEFLQCVREEHPELPFILLTGEGSEKIASEAISAGVTDYFRKEGGTDQYTVLAHRIGTAVESYRVKQRADRIEQEHRLIADCTTDAFWTTDLDTGDVRMSGLEHFGYDDYEPTRDWWTQRLHPADRERVLDRNDAFRAGETDVFDDWHDDRGWFTVEYRWQRADGTYADCIERGIVLFESGEPHKMVGTMTDIAERREREQELCEKSNLLDELFEQVPVHLYVKDTEGRYLHVSEFYVRDEFEWIADDTDSILGKTDLEFEEGVGEEAYADDMQVIETGEPIIDKEEYDPQFENWFLTSKVPWYGPDGDISGLIGVTRRITERKEAELELERQNERLDEFAGVVSHDLRNPLNVAEGRLELARRECDSEHLDRAANAVDRSLALIEDLLTLAREGVQVSEFEAVDLREISEECWENVETNEPTVVVATDRTIRADASRLKQLLENLIRNAVDHGGDDMTLTIGDLDDGFYVADDGPGIPSDERDRVFEAGYSTAEEGTGFGLNIAQDIAEAHGWQIWATESKEGGARFEITGIEFAD